MTRQEFERKSKKLNRTADILKLHLKIIRMFRAGGEETNRVLNSVDGLNYLTFSSKASRNGIMKYIANLVNEYNQIQQTFLKRLRSGDPSNNIESIYGAKHTLRMLKSCLDPSSRINRPDLFHSRQYQHTKQDDRMFQRDGQTFIDLYNILFKIPNAYYQYYLNDVNKIILAPVLKRINASDLAKDQAKHIIKHNNAIRLAVNVIPFAIAERGILEMYRIIASGLASHNFKNYRELTKTSDRLSKRNLLYATAYNRLGWSYYHNTFTHPGSVAEQTYRYYFVIIDIARKSFNRNLSNITYTPFATDGYNRKIAVDYLSHLIDNYKSQHQVSN